MSIRSASRRWLAVLGAAALTAAAPAPAPAGPLRICADPDNLPFSKAEGPERGLYMELAELVSRRLGATPEYVWWLTFNQRRALRNTILQDGCDAYFAVPADADYKLRGLQRTRAFIDVSYAVVAPTGLAVASLADLKGKRVAVLHGSPPHILLSSREGHVPTTFREQHEALAALARGEVDAAILWGPSAGYDLKKRADARWRLTPVSGDGLNGQMAVAVKRGNDALAAGIEKALNELQPEIDSLARKYGFPQGKLMPLSQVQQAQRVARAQALAESHRVHGGWVKASDQRAVPAAAGTTVAQASGGDVKAGRTRFNDACSHCHGTDGFSPVPERDLRKLRARYKDGWRDTANVTIRNGRNDAGMPSWKTAFSDKEIEEVMVFLATIQR